MSSAIERSLKDKIKQISKDKQRAFNAVWQGLVLERFLSRLTRSRHREKFVFKGGMLLACYIELGRETTDLDFLLQNLQGELEPVSDAVKEVLEVELNDGFTFEFQKIAEIDHLQTPYPGFAVSIIARCGDTKTNVSLDIGVGDVVVSKELTISLSRSTKGPIFESDISLLVYPPESIFAEKLETACFRGIQNSRMKDYQDLWTMALSEKPLVWDFGKLGQVLNDTFSHRGTELGLIPLADDDDCAKQEQYWQSHLRSLNLSLRESLPESFQEVVRQINEWLRNNLGLK